VLSRDSKGRGESLYQRLEKGVIVGLSFFFYHYIVTVGRKIRQPERLKEGGSSLARAKGKGRAIAAPRWV